MRKIDFQAAVAVGERLTEIKQFFFGIFRIFSVYKSTKMPNESFRWKTVLTILYCTDIYRTSTFWKLICETKFFCAIISDLWYNITYMVRFRFVTVSENVRFRPKDTTKFKCLSLLLCGRMSPWSKIILRRKPTFRHSTMYIYSWCLSKIWFREKKINFNFKLQIV